MGWLRRAQAQVRSSIDLWYGLSSTCGTCARARGSISSYPSTESRGSLIAIGAAQGISPQLFVFDEREGRHASPAQRAGYPLSIKGLKDAAIKARKCLS